MAVHAEVLHSGDKNVCNSFYWRRGKRIFDVVGTLILLGVFGIPMVCLAILVKMNSPGPVFFKQERETKDRKRFLLIKFRTMTHEEPSVVTGLGRLLRPYALNELPQLFNVLRGEMSLVGPRPHAIPDIERYIGEHPPYARRAVMKAGFTGLAQARGLFGRTEGGLADMVSADLEYVERASVWLDIAIVLRTVWILKKGH